MNFCPNEGGQLGIWYD